MHKMVHRWRHSTDQRLFVHTAPPSLICFIYICKLVGIINGGKGIGETIRIVACIIYWFLTSVSWPMAGGWPPVPAILCRDRWCRSRLPCRSCPLRPPRLRLRRSSSNHPSVWPSTTAARCGRFVKLGLSAYLPRSIPINFIKFGTNNAV